MRILALAIVIISNISAVPSHAVKNTVALPHAGGAAGLHVMPATVKMPGIIGTNSIQQTVVNQAQVNPVIAPAQTVVNQAVSQAQVNPVIASAMQSLPGQPKPLPVLQGVTQPSVVQPTVVSDQVFLQNTMNKLLGDKLKIVRDKIGKYKKIIQNNANILEQKVKAFFA